MGTQIAYMDPKVEPWKGEPPYPQGTPITPRVAKSFRGLDHGVFHRLVGGDRGVRTSCVGGNLKSVAGCSIQRGCDHAAGRRHHADWDLPARHHPSCSSGARRAVVYYRSAGDLRGKPVFQRPRYPGDPASRGHRVPRGLLHPSRVGRAPMDPIRLSPTDSRAPAGRFERAQQ